MASITRVWLAFAAIGTALIHFSLASASANLATVVAGTIAVVLAGLGVFELCWGIAMFVCDRVIAPNAALVVTSAPVVAWGLLVLLASGLGAPAALPSLGLVPLAIAAVFELFIASVLAVRRRRLRRPGAADGIAEPGTMRYLGGLLAASIVVAVLTTPALAYSGASLPPQDEHSGNIGLVVPSHH